MVIATRSITESGRRGVARHLQQRREPDQYLADFEATNLAALPRAKVSQQMGWQGKDGQVGLSLGP